MKVKDLILYQIATDRDYKVGDVFYFGEGENYQAERTFNSDFIINGKRLSELGYRYVDGSNIFKNKNLVLKLSKALEEYDFIVRELAMEKVRKEEFPNLPSRMSCMFLTEKRENVINNLNMFHVKGHGKQFQAVAVKVTGNAFYAKKTPVSRYGISYGGYLNLAKKYWSQKQTGRSKSYEILFEGRAEIVEIIDEFNYNKEEEK